MNFYQKYELLEVLRDDGVKSFQGRELSTGREVEVHLFVGVPGKSEPPYDLVDKIRNLSGESRSHLLEVGEHLGTPYVVTLPLQGFSHLRDWVNAKSATAAPPPARGYDPLSRVGRWRVPPASPPAPAPAPAVPAAGSDITAMFNTAEMLPMSATAPPPASLQPPPAVPSPASVADEFDQMFGASPVTGATGQFPAPVAATPAAAPEKPQPFLNTGEREVPVQQVIPEPELPRPALAVTQKSAPAAVTPAAAQPGEFTSMFQTSQMKTPEPPPVAVTPAAAQPGEFTSMFQTSQ
ncbi:MAG: hypothetical protein JNK48_14755, partial [Bryobacterales bacterium]|nr:hypothetical protein [Bryobacterales bacterium]